MRFFSLLFRSLLILLVSLPLVLAVLLIDREPVIPEQPPLDRAEVEAVQQLLIDNDPRRLLGEEEQNIHLPEADADTLIKYFFNQTPQLREMRGRVEMEDTRAEMILTRPLPSLPFDAYLNIRIGFSEADDPVLRISYLKVGALELPEALLTPILEKLSRHYQGQPDYRLLVSVLDTIESVNLSKDQIAVHVEWDDQGITQLGNQARDVFIAPSEQERISAYFRLIRVEEAAHLQAGSSRVSLNALLRPLFTRAYDRALEGIDPVLENRALLMALAIYLTDLDLSQISNEENSGADTSPRQLTLTVNSRLDLAQHIVTSAAISASSSASVADLMSMYKEVHDARYRTGFSFNDLTASQVGAALGTIATRDHSSAHRVQNMLKDVTTEDFYMPALLADVSMNEESFAELYGDRQSEAFQQRLQEISNDISQRPFFEHFNYRIMPENLSTLTD